MTNLFENLPRDIPAEVCDTLLQAGAFRIERIVSQGHASPEGLWYDQPEHEWVLVVRGRANLRIADADETLELGPGDFCHIPAHVRHRVEWTTPAEPTIWLAVHYPVPSRPEVES